MEEVEEQLTELAGIFSEKEAEELRKNIEITRSQVEDRVDRFSEELLTSKF